jgi:RNA polymerase sigma-70 factor (ECF subfamily)
VQKTTQLDEDKLISMLKSNDKSDFSVFYDYFSGALYGMILQVTNGNKDLADDCLQNAFVKIWKNAAAYDSSKGRLFTWMVNIVRNTAIDGLRSSKSGIKGKIQTLPDHVDFKADEADADKLETIKSLEKLLGGMKDEWKEVIQLVYFKGFTQEEAAQLLELPLGTVKTRCRSAIIKLRELLHE